MYRYVLIFIILMKLSVLHAKEYDFNELLELAKKNSIATEIIKTNILATRAKLDELSSDYFPKINAVLGSEKRDIRSQSSLETSNFVAELHLDYNVFKFGATSKAMNALRVIEKNQESHLEVSKKNISRTLKKEFSKGLHLKELKKILTDELIFNKKLKKQVKKRQRRGLVGKADVLEIDMRDATLRQRLLIIEEELDHTKDNIRKMTLINHEEELLFKGSIPHEHFDVDPKELIEAAKKFNKKYLNTKTSVNSLSYQLESSKAKRLPQVNLRGRYGRQTFDNRVTTNSTEAVVGIYLDVPIFDGGEKKSVTNSYRAMLAKKTLEMNRSYRNLDIDVMHRYEKMKNIHKQVDLAEKNVENAKVYFKSVLSEYKKGVKNSLDLVSSRDRLLNFIINLIIAKKDFIVSKIELEEVAGVSFE